VTFKIAVKNNFFPKFFFVAYFEATFTSFFKDKKSLKKSQNSRNVGFSYFFCLMIEESGSVPRTNGSNYKLFFFFLSLLVRYFNLLCEELAIFSRWSESWEQRRRRWEVLTRKGRTKIHILILTLLNNLFASGMVSVDLNLG
jgi:hypothetical protein